MRRPGVESRSVRGFGAIRIVPRVVVRRRGTRAVADVADVTTVSARADSRVAVRNACDLEIG